MASTSSAASSSSAPVNSEIALPDIDRCLELTVFRGRQLAAKDKNGLSDPYIKVFLVQNGKPIRKSVKKCSKVRKSLNPIFQNCTYTWKQKHLQGVEKVVVEVWDWDALTRDDFMGMVEFSLGGNAFVHPSEWKELKSRPGKNDRIEGDILVSVAYNPDGLTGEVLTTPTVAVSELKVNVHKALAKAGSDKEKKELKDMLAQLEKAEKKHAKSKIPGELRVTINIDPDFDPVEEIDTDVDIDDPNAPTVECSVCWEDVGANNMVSFDCNHDFCRKCIKEQVNAKINSGDVLEIVCPQKDCNQAPTDEQVRRICGRSMYTKFRQFRALRQLRQNPNARWCTNKECSIPIVVDPTEIKDKLLTCPVCKTEMCFECRRAYHGKNSNCDEVNMEGEEGAFRQYLSNLKDTVKPCPNCQVQVEKNAGCNHMTCANCSHNWCWLCLEELPNRTDQSAHYRSGRCAGHWFTAVNTLEEAEAVQNAEREFRRQHPIQHGFKKVGGTLAAVAIGTVVVIGVAGVVVLAVALIIPLAIIGILFG